MDTTVNYEKITENDSIWSVFKKFFSCSENEDELNEKKIREVENICFVPMPEVTSEVINLRLRKEPAVKVENKKVFFNIIKSAFMQRRKTLLNALVNTGVFKSKEEGAEILRKLNLREDIRAEKLTIEDFARICNYFCESIK